LPACWVAFNRIGLDRPDRLPKAGLVICHVPFHGLERYFILLERDALQRMLEYPRIFINMLLSPIETFFLSVFYFIVMKLILSIGETLFYASFFLMTLVQ
jgi:hypothetical protein